MREVGIKHLRHTEELHDYTELVIELWDSYKFRELNLTDLGGSEGSRAGIDRIQCDALFFLDMVEDEESKGWWWDGGWTEAVQAWAYYNSSTAKWGNIGQVYSLTDYMVPKEEHPDHITGWMEG